MHIALSISALIRQEWWKKNDWLTDTCSTTVSQLVFVFFFSARTWVLVMSQTSFLPWNVFVVQRYIDRVGAGCELEFKGKSFNKGSKQLLRNSFEIIFNRINTLRWPLEFYQLGQPLSSTCDLFLRDWVICEYISWNHQMASLWSNFCYL